MALKSKRFQDVVEIKHNATEQPWGISKNGSSVESTV